MNINIFIFAPDTTKQITGMQIGILGTGSVGSRLGKLWQKAGHDVFYGSRRPVEKTDLSASVGTHADAIGTSDVILIATPWADGNDKVTLELLKSLGTMAGKLLIDATNPLKSDWSPILLGETNSAAEEIARLFPLAHVVKAFNTIFADVMEVERIARFPEKPTAFLCGNNTDAKQVIIQLATDAGFDPVDAGKLSNARYLEGMAHLNIQIAATGGTNVAFRYMR
jgi:8-hydroxy-5-deazaflavin:NADPH oxidoreductase